MVAVIVCVASWATAELPGDLAPQSWFGPTPTEIQVLEEAWRLQFRALNHERRAVSMAFEADVDAERLRRFDPEREATLDVRVTPQVGLSWSPYADRIAREAARLAELEVELIEAWNDALITPRANAVRWARLNSDLTDANQEVAALQDEASKAKRDAGSFGSWKLDLASARLDAQEARLGLAALPEDLPAEQRVALPLPEAVDVEGLRSFQAARTRLEARLARAERRVRGETMGSWTVGWGHAGSDVRIETEAGFDAGRPSWTADLGFEGTSRERSWVALRGRVAFSLAGKHLLEERRAAQTALDRFDASEASVRQHQQFLDLQQARLSLEDWKVTEARFREAQRTGSSKLGVLEDRARRAWLRHARDARQAWDAVEQIVPLPK